MNGPLNAPLPLVAVLVASVALGACGSSSDDDDPIPEDQPGGATAGGGTTGAATGGGDGGGTGAAPSPTDGGGTDDGTGADDGGGMGDDAGGGAGADDGAGTGEGTGTGGGTGTGDGGGGAVGGVLGGLPVSGSATDLGFVQLEQPVAGTEGGSVGAFFFRFGLELPLDQLAAQLIPPLDTCTVTRISPTGPDIDPGDGDGPDIAFEFLSAGETITFSSPAGTWLTLPLQEQFGFLAYTTEDDLPLPVPSGLVLDIPGDQYPAFADVPVPDVTPLSGVEAGSPAVTPDTIFRWNPGSGAPGVYVEIEAFAFDMSTGDSVSLDCAVRDDGEFSLSAETRAELGANFSGIASVSRTGLSAAQQGNALLLIVNESPAN